MGVKNGAGAAVSSGAGYQARIASYILATAMCEAESILPQDACIKTIGFETAESIDDINICLSNGQRMYIQAKANIAFSLSQSGELRAVFQQFESQDARQPNDRDKFVLATSSRSSKKISYELRAALDAFRTSPEQDFFRDQPKALKEIISESRQAIYALQELIGRPRDPQAADRILRKSYVVLLDVEAGDSLESAVVLTLQSRRFSAPSAVWGKLIADCVEHAKARHTLSLAEFKEQYEKYRFSETGSLPQEADDLIQVELGELHFSVGKEVVLCRVTEDTKFASKGLAVIEFYRFDDGCNERIKFTDDAVILGSGATFPLYRRSATYSGMTRYIQSNKDFFESEEITFYPANLNQEVEANPCAEIHRAKLRQAAKRNNRITQCLHCGRPVSEEAPCLIEIGSLNEPVVGLCHTKCLKPNDRLIGKALMEFFNNYPELVNFDADAWLRSSHGGQIAIGGSQLIAHRTKCLLWGGDKMDWPDGQFVVEISLQGGGSEIVTQRNNVHRFSKIEAENAAREFNQSFKKARAQSDPFCYTEQSKVFSLRSLLLEQFGGRERIFPVETAKVRKYEERFANRYHRPGSWYAPLLYLRDLETGEPFCPANNVLFISNPLHLKNFLENWREGGFDIPNYEIACLLTDAEFDSFMRAIEARGWYAVIDPILDPSDRTLISGLPIGSQEKIAHLQK